MTIEEPHHIIALGASAGGIEEINTFFENTPLDGVAYIVVQHLSGDFESRMVELLSRHSKLEVLRAANGMPVKSNHVYLIPNDSFMTIQGRCLYLTDKEKASGPYLTIDTFFFSLAADCGSKAIGVILSGLGSDGTKGINAIKKAGGMTIARDPVTSEFHSMPANAIATGMIDFILEPELMPATIEEYVGREIDLAADRIKEDEKVTEIIELINQQLPFDFSDYKQSTILRRIKRRAAHNNFDNLEFYLQFLKSNPLELEALSKDFLISVTAFFRDKDAFHFIGEEVLPGIIRDLKPDDELRLWVTGCATGEEAYSLAILICEILGTRINEIVVKIFATDIDTAALEHAGRGIYSSATASGLSEERLAQFFTLDGDAYKVKPELRKMVIFAQHDLVKNPPYCNIHFISCRNLLIYMTPALQKKIYLMLLFGLRQDGYLFLGSSENPMPILQSLEVVSKMWKVYKNLDHNQAVRFDAFSLPEVTYKKPVSAIPLPENTFKNAEHTLADAVNETLMMELGYLVICVDQHERIIKSYGDTSKYLLQKILTSDLAELLPTSLSVAFKTTFRKVIETQTTSTVKAINVEQNNEMIGVSLSISPMMFRGRHNGLYVVIIAEHGDVLKADNDETFDVGMYLIRYTEQLEQDNRDLKDQLQGSNEKLFSLNENMQSFNEELLSANEEMQSTNEEMQSINEELHTINSDYQLKNKELILLNDDLNNYFRSNVSGQLFVNNDMLLMKFSPGMVKLINLLATDIGRPIGNISTNFKFESISNDIKEVLLHGTVITKEIESTDGHWYQISTMPYIQQISNTRDGAIITFNDITELKNIQKELDRKNKSLMRINADLDNFVHTTSHDLLAPLGNIESSIDIINRINVTDPDITEILSVINSSVKKFRTLISDIATIGKIENSSLSPEHVDLNEILDNIEWSLSDLIRSSGAVINRDLPVTHIFFPKKNLRSILFNLVSNALKFRSAASPVIYIRSVMKKGDILLTVEDNGIGMDQDQLDGVFKKYVRYKDEIEGQGIGLYLAKKIVDAAGGDITVKSEVGHGSVFTICFDHAAMPPGV